ncbi:MAG: CpsD/CapB family tyrosine-protein kinase [Oscillospiraceae bacterium]|nr:CpsD/CapB family tyrosine-protein kinase [Oscillospiraceae bacterium]
MKQIEIGNMPHPDYFVQSEIDRLRVNVSFFGTEKKVLMITSSGPNEGKSYISMNLWNELAKAGKRVCFVDADMRKSTIRTTFQVSTGSDEYIGLSHYLAGYVEAEDVIYTTEREEAFFIPTSTMINPSLLLEGDRFRDLVKLLRRRFDYVIVDTPPLGIVSDGQRIATMCDGVMLVVRAHVTSREAVRASIQQIQQVECPLLGIVLNRVEGKRTKGYYAKTYYSNDSGRSSSKSEPVKRTIAPVQEVSAPADLDLDIPNLDEILGIQKDEADHEQSAAEE